MVFETYFLPLLPTPLDGRQKELSHEEASSHCMHHCTTHCMEWSRQGRTCPPPPHLTQAPAFAAGSAWKEAQAGRCLSKTGKFFEFIHKTCSLGAVHGRCLPSSPFFLGQNLLACLLTLPACTRTAVPENRIENELSFHCL